MANNRIQIKRTSIAGRTANVTNSGNSQYIAAGELALNMPDGILYTSNGSALITVGANQVNQNINGNLTVKAIIANGSIGTAGQTLTSNGSSVYWAVGAGTGTVTQVDTGNGLTGGPITSTGTVSVLANTGIVANSTGVFVNSSYIGTLTANNTSFVGSVSAANVVSNAQLSANLANYQTTAGLASNVATLTSNNATNAFGKTEGALNVNSALTANNSTNLGGVAASSYVNTSGNYTLSGNITFLSNVSITKLLANNSLGSSNQILTSNGTGIYWAESSIYMKGGSSTIGSLAAGGQNIFRVNANTLNFNTTISTGENASATGPVTVASGITLTVETGARVSIV